VLLTLLSEQPAYYELTLANAAGQETIRITRGEVITTDDLASRADDPLFQRAVETSAVSFNPVYFNQDARDRLVTIAVPVKPFSGETGNMLLQVRSDGPGGNRNLITESGCLRGQSGGVVVPRNPNWCRDGFRPCLEPLAG
jgi:hypothetical protein